MLSNPTSAPVVSASVSALLSHSLRSMIMTRLVQWACILTVSVGVAATVLAQTATNKPATAGRQAATALAELITARPDIPPVFEYEIRVWKDGVPLTQTVKVMAIPGEPSLLPTSEGTVELLFHPRAGSLPNAGDALKPTTTEADPREAALSLARARFAREVLARKQRTNEIAEAVRELVKTADREALQKRAQPDASASDDHESASRKLSGNSSGF